MKNLVMITLLAMLTFMACSPEQIDETNSNPVYSNVIQDNAVSLDIKTTPNTNEGSEASGCWAYCYHSVYRDWIQACDNGNGVIRYTLMVWTDDTAGGHWDMSNLSAQDATDWCIKNN